MADSESLKDNLRASSQRISLSPASLRTVEALNSRRQLSPSPSRSSRSPGPVIASSHGGINDLNMTSSRTMTSKYESHSETEGRVVRHTKVQAEYHLLSSDLTSDDVRTRSLTGTHGDVTGYEATHNPRIRAMYETRLKELEEELINERSSRSKAEKQRLELKTEISVVNERLEAALSANQMQTEITRKRENDIQRLQREVDELQVQHDIQLGSYRKKHQEAISQMTEQIDRLHANRQKSDREKIQFRVEVEELGQQVEQLTKAKISAEKSNRQLEAEVSQLNVKVSDLQRELREIESQRNRLQQEQSESSPRIGELENQLAQANKAKLALSRQLDELKHADDTESTVRVRLAAENRSLQELIEQVKEQLTDEREARVEMQRQLTKALSEASNWRQKYESSDNGSNPDVEEFKKRLAVRLNDCEAKLGSAQAKINALEKVNNKLQQETEALVAELDKYQTTNVQQEKRIRQNDKLMEEWQIKLNEVTTKLDMSQIEARQHSADSNQFKSQFEDTREQNAALKRENKSLAEEVRNLKDQLRHSKQTLLELEKSSQRFEAERDSLQGTVEAMESALQQKESRVERALMDAAAIKQEMEKRLLDKDEELQNVRKIHQRALDAIQLSLDSEAKSRMEAVLVKKRLEQDINELELTLDSVNRARAEAERNWKQCQQELSDLEELLDEEQKTKYAPPPINEPFLLRLRKFYFR